jgi:hypothetical protein
MKRYRMLWMSFQRFSSVPLFECYNKALGTVTSVLENVLKCLLRLLERVPEEYVTLNYATVASFHIRSIRQITTAKFDG